MEQDLCAGETKDMVQGGCAEGLDIWCSLFAARVHELFQFRFRDKEMDAVPNIDLASLLAVWKARERGGELGGHRACRLTGW